MSFMKTKRIFQCLTALMVWTMIIGVVSCGKDDETPINPLIIDDPNGTILPILVLDPEGTVTVNINRDNSITIDPGLISLDAANNFIASTMAPILNTIYTAQIASVGKVGGLAYITSIPTAGWANTVAVDVGMGYVMRVNVSVNYVTGPTTTHYYARIYVVDSTSSGFTIKYQYPFILPIELNSSTINFSKASERKFITMKSPTTIANIIKPDWCTVSIDNNYIYVTASANSGEERTGEIVLQNQINSATITVIQE